MQKDGVRVNAVSPGPAKTARFQATRTVDPDKMNSNKVSMDRYAEPEEIAGTVEGRRVVAFLGNGGYAERVAVPEGSQ